MANELLKKFLSKKDVGFGSQVFIISGSVYRLNASNSFGITYKVFSRKFQAANTKCSQMPS